MSHTTTNRPAIDYLTFLLPGAEWHEDDGKERFAKICRRVDKAIVEGKCLPSFVRGQRYKKSFRIVLPSGEKATVLLGAAQPEHQKGGVRISLNPAKLKPGDIEYFHRTMAGFLGKIYRQQLSTPLLNRFDVAVDILHADLDRLLVSYKNNQRVTMFAKRFGTNGHIEGYNFGSLSSDYIAAVYDKKTEALHRIMQKIAANGLQTEELRANCVRQIRHLQGLPEKTRVEIRAMKLRSLPPSELSKLANRFARFQFIDLSMGECELPPHIEKAFLAIWRQNGSKDAFDYAKSTGYYRQIRKYWRSRTASWWKPETMWSDACEALKESGIFPADAFSLPDLRDEDEDEFLV